MSQRQARALNPDEERFESGRFLILELYLTGDEEEYCYDRSYEKILTVFEDFPGINRRARKAYKVTPPEGAKYFIGAGPRAIDLAKKIQQRKGHFVAWRQVEHKELATLHWLTEIQPRPAIRIMNQIELKFILPRIEQMIDNGAIWYDESSHVWLVEPELFAKRKKSKRREVPRKSRPMHGRPRSQVRRRNLPSGTSTGTSKRSGAVNRKTWPQQKAS